MSGRGASTFPTMKSSPLVSLLVVVVLILGSPQAASASTVTQRDKVGDSVARTDIVSMRYSNGPRAFGFRMKLRDIQPKHGTLAFPKLLVRGTWNRHFKITVGARRNGHRFHSLWLGRPIGGRRVACPGMRASVDFAHDVVKARVPQPCFGKFSKRRYLAVGYVTVPGSLEASDETAFRWVRYD